MRAQSHLVFHTTCVMDSGEVDAGGIHVEAGGVVGDAAGADVVVVATPATRITGAVGGVAGMVAAAMAATCGPGGAGGVAGLLGAAAPDKRSSGTPVKRSRGGDSVGADATVGADAVGAAPSAVGCGSGTGAQCAGAGGAGTGGALTGGTGGAITCGTGEGWKEAKELADDGGIPNASEVALVTDKFCATACDHVTYGLVG